MLLPRRAFAFARRARRAALRSVFIFDKLFFEKFAVHVGHGRVRVHDFLKVNYCCFVQLCAAVPSSFWAVLLSTSSLELLETM